MIDCDKLIERKDLRKAVSRKKGLKREMAGKKERQRCKKFSLLGRHLADAYERSTVSIAGISPAVRGSPTPSATSNCYFQH